VTNGVLIVVAFIFVVAVLYGDNDTQNISVFIAATFLLLLGPANPLFDPAIVWPAQSNFGDKWKAAKGLSFIGTVLLLLSVFITGKRGKLIPSVSVLPYDFVAFAIALAGAVSVWAKIPDATSLDGTKQRIEYATAFAVVITVVNLLQGVLGLDAGQYISTFFASVVLMAYDLGSTNGTTGYLRGGLQLCQLGVLLSIFLKAFPADKPLLSYVHDNKVATGFGLLWLLLAMLKVPNNYSIFVLIAIITYRAITSGDANWYRTTFYILSFFGVAGSFPLNASWTFATDSNSGSRLWFTTLAADDANFNYVNSLGWVASVYFLTQFASHGAATAPALDLPDGLVAEAVAAVEKVAEEVKNEPTDAAASA